MFKHLITLVVVLSFCPSGFSADQSESNAPATKKADVIRLDVLGLPAVAPKFAESSDDDQAVSQLIASVVNLGLESRIPLLEGFAKENRKNRWRDTILLTLSRDYYFTGRFSQSLETLEALWKQYRKESSLFSTQLAAELSSLHARLGNQEELEAILKATKNQPASIDASEKLIQAREGLKMMKGRPRDAFKCGPFALKTIAARLGYGEYAAQAAVEAQSKGRGFNFQEVRDLSTKVGLDMVVARRSPGAPLPIPCVVHWKVGHYAAIVDSAEGRYHVYDPTFIQEFFITDATLQQESSGAYAIRRADLGKGWTEIPDKEAARIIGKGAVDGQNGDDCKDNGDCPEGMAVASLDRYRVGAVIRDMPLFHNSPLGQVPFTFTYMERSHFDLSSFGISNAGPGWFLNWFSFLRQVDSSANRMYYDRSGRRDTHYYQTLSPLTFKRQNRSREQLSKFGTNGYLLDKPDGSQEYFEREITVGGFLYNLLTKVVDPQGNETVLTYDSSGRLEKVTDPFGTETTFSYENGSFPNVVTKITGEHAVNGSARFALLTYDSSGRLTKIADPEGIESSFAYENGSRPSMVTKLTTPYGATRFTSSSGNPETTLHSWAELEDPLGRKERMEFIFNTSTTMGNDPISPNPALIDVANAGLYMGITQYWDKKTYALHPPGTPGTGESPNSGFAVWYHWMAHQVAVPHHAASALHSIKMPFENRIWFEYPGQSYIMYQGNVLGARLGSVDLPKKSARVLEDGTTQVYEYEYTDLGNPTRIVDPLGREVLIEYDTNGIDVLRLKRKKAGVEHLVSELIYDASYPPHCPRYVKDGGGYTSEMTYNTRGQILTVKNAKNEVTAITYDSNGFPDLIDGPVSGTTDSYDLSYDANGRLVSVTGPDGYQLQYEFDKLDRLTRTEFPDSTEEVLGYTRPDGAKLIDLCYSIDRKGRRTEITHNALREVIAVLDPANRLTRYNWCFCGALQDLWDQNGNRTHWDYDIGGRLTAKRYADGKGDTYSYDVTGRLKTRVDSLGQRTEYSYNTDDSLKKVQYPNAIHATPSVEYFYESVIARLASRVDGMGTTTFAYQPYSNGTKGAGQLATEDGPLADDTIAFTYDELGRSKTRSIHGSRNQTELVYDALGRISQTISPLGTKTFTYVGHTGRPSQATWGHGLKTLFDYFTASGDFRLKTLEHQTGASVSLSKFDYTHDVVGNIVTWQQRYGSNPAKMWQLEYDRVDQLTRGGYGPASSPTSIESDIIYRYDKAGNRVGLQKEMEVTSGTFNNLNQLRENTPGGDLLVKGKLDEPGSVSVSVDSGPATALKIDPDHNFSGVVTVGSGQHTLSVTATDSSPNTNVTTKNYSVDLTGLPSRKHRYDANGNLVQKTENGVSTVYSWDAEDRLVKIAYGNGKTTEFRYDGLSRWNAIIEKTGGVTTQYRRMVWSGLALTEERDEVGRLRQRFYGDGIVLGISGTPQAADRLYIQTDHLGSTRQVIDGSDTLKAEYNYDLFGVPSKLSGAYDCDLLFTGHFVHWSGLVLAPYRAYDPTIGRWLSRDPIKEDGGLNLYGYVHNSPISFQDPLGLSGSLADLYEEMGGGDLAADVRKEVDGQTEEIGSAIAEAVRNTIELIPGAKAAKVRKCLGLADGVPSLPESYWKKKKAPTQVPPGTKSVTDSKPSSRKEETYERTTHYDEYGRSTGQTHKTDHNEPEVHPNPHHHSRNPITGETSGAKPGLHPQY